MATKLSGPRRGGFGFEPLALGVEAVNGNASRRPSRQGGKKAKEAGHRYGQIGWCGRRRGHALGDEARPPAGSRRRRLRQFSLAGPGRAGHKLSGDLRAGQVWAARGRAGLAIRSTSASGRAACFQPSSGNERARGDRLHPAHGSHVRGSRPPGRRRCGRRTVEMGPRSCSPRR